MLSHISYAFLLDIFNAKYFFGIYEISLKSF